MQLTAQTITLNALQWVRIHAPRMNRVHAHIQDVPAAEAA
jgi:hypothetical protein